MSGGSFEYVCFKLDSQGWEVPQALPQLKKMEQFLREAGKHEAADELLRGIMRIETAVHRLGVVGKHLFELTHDAEWWVSGDINEKDFDNDFRVKYLGEKENENPN